jgi:gas vesicle protein
MRAFIAFLLGSIIGAAAVVYLPNIHREELNSQIRQQIKLLQDQVHDLGEQLKNVQIPKPGQSPETKPRPTVSPTPG